MTECTTDKNLTQRKVTHERTGCSVFPYDKLYHCWNGMIRRCSEPNHIAWHNYGGRGIYVCDEWKDLDEFMKWALGSGYERGLQIDRIDNESGYFPSNCRWVSLRDNRNNTRTNVLANGFGETKTIAEWSRDARCTVSYDTLYERIQCLNWSTEKALSTPCFARKEGNIFIEAFGETKTLKEWSKDSRCVVAYKTLWHRIQVRNWEPEDAITLTSSPVARAKR